MFPSEIVSSVNTSNINIDSMEDENICENSNGSKNSGTRETFVKIFTKISTNSLEANLNKHVERKVGNSF